MEHTFASRVFVASLKTHLGSTVVLRCCIYRLRVLAKTTFVVLRDSSGEVQCVGDSQTFGHLHLKLDDAIEVIGAPLTLVARAALAESGLARFEETTNGFRAKRA